MHTFTAKHVIYDSKATTGPLGVEVYLSPQEWQSYQASGNREAEVAYQLVDESQHQRTFGDVDQVDLIELPDVPPYFKATFWFAHSTG